MDSCSELLRNIDTLNRLLGDEVAVNKDLKERLYALEGSLLDDAALEGGRKKPSGGILPLPRPPPGGLFFAPGIRRAERIGSSIPESNKVVY